MSDNLSVKDGLRSAVFCVILVFGIAGTIIAQDVFGTKDLTPSSPASPLFDDKTSTFGPLSQPLTFREAMERALYNNPKTQEAWATIKAQAAGVGIGYSAYLPTLSGTLQGAREVSKTDVNDNPQLNSDTWANTNTESLSLSWVLYDFGGRDAGLENAKELLAAARANHEVTLRDVFSAVAKDYYAAQAAQGNFATAAENERIAKDSFNAASQRVEKGVSPISDQLQADTARYQAVVSLTKAEGDWHIATGTLAVDMGLRPDALIILPEVDDGVKPDETFQQSVSILIDNAIGQHPSVQVAQAQLKAAEDKVKQIRAGGLPTLSLVAESSRNDEPLNEEVGVSSFKATELEDYVGAKIDIPFFEGFSRTYQIQQAQAQVEAQRDALNDARQQVGLNVWESYQTLKSSSENIANSAKLLDVAQKSYVAAQGRYLGGVGNMTEWLDAQTALASARFQWVKSLTDWRASRLELASKLGEMDAWWIKENK